MPSPVLNLPKPTPSSVKTPDSTPITTAPEEVVDVGTPTASPAPVAIISSDVSTVGLIESPIDPPVTETVSLSS